MADSRPSAPARHDAAQALTAPALAASPRQAGRQQHQRKALPGFQTRRCSCVSTDPARSGCRPRLPALRRRQTAVERRYRLRACRAVVPITRFCRAAPGRQPAIHDVSGRMHGNVRFRPRYHEKIGFAVERNGPAPPSAEAPRWRCGASRHSPDPTQACRVSHRRERETGVDPSFELHQNGTPQMPSASGAAFRKPTPAAAPATEAHTSRSWRELRRLAVPSPA